MRSGLRPHLIDRPLEAERPSAIKLSIYRQTAPFEIEQELLLGLRALADAVSKPDEFLLAFGSGADNYEQTLCVVSSRAWT